jgi:hypothetical protein
VKAPARSVELLTLSVEVEIERVVETAAAEAGSEDRSRGPGSNPEQRETFRPWLALKRLLRLAS